ncbi:organic solute transporter Ostalpha-domain-containing protein [Clohesyomyces aquaticus]|uniref:Organic solute transporter Ostalpha-domain-containing protein n=1 Tax=Clohesyomyces aquaticus TaxID=1231657 RepID=A0A1Y1ZY07_9PLEO|nr:organic solute transporter Ostalpha-domain-containing protein [Clohesyomyces aquaticus]
MPAPTCEAAAQEEERIKEEPIWHSLTFHHLGLILSAVFGLLSVCIALFLIMRHATHYLKPWEQKHIIRILFMIPIYATVSFLSYMFYRHAVYFEVLRDCYEAFAIASFFTLMCHYVAPNLHEQKEYFRGIEPKNWVWPMNWMQKCTGGESKGIFRKPSSGLTWFNIVWIAIFQYCFIRVAFTIVAVTTQAFGLYCSSSMDPRYSHIWVITMEGLSVTVAMFCLIQFYVQLKGDLAPYRPFLKVLCIKLVIFFCFWQALVISFLTREGGPLKTSPQIQGPDLRIGIPSMLVCVEMAIFAVMHLFAFPWKPYDLKRNQNPLDAAGNGFSGDVPKRYAHGPARALASAFNPWDIIKACGRGFRWLFVGVRYRKADKSYQTKLESLDTSTGYAGPTFAGNGEAAAEFDKPRKDTAALGKNGFDDPDDRAGLLSHAQANPYVGQDAYTSFSHGRPDPILNPDSLPTAPTPGQEYGVTRSEGGRRTKFEPQETSSHGVTVGQSAPRPPRENAGRQGTEWDLFGGATKPGQGHPPRPPGGAPPGMI